MPGAIRGAVLGVLTAYTAEKVGGEVISYGMERTVEGVKDHASQQGRNAPEAQRFARGAESFARGTAEGLGLALGAKFIKNSASSSLSQTPKFTTTTTSTANGPRRIGKEGPHTRTYPTSQSTTTTRTTTSSAKEPLMSTEFSKQSRSYIKDMETRSGMLIPSQQRIILKETLQKQKFDILEGIEAKKHKAPFKNSNFKDDLIKQWQDNTKQEWPVYKENLYNKKGGIMAEVGERLQVHHIIPQQHGGPHEWWNIHPLTIPDHQGGVHAGNSALRKMLKDNLK